MHTASSPLHLTVAVAMCLAGMLLAGCAGAPKTISPPVDPTAPETPYDSSLSSTAGLVETDVQCQYQRVTGSHLMEKVCTTAAQRKNREDAAKQWMRTGGRSGGVSRVRDSADPRDDEKD